MLGDNLEGHYLFLGEDPVVLRIYLLYPPPKSFRRNLKAIILEYAAQFGVEVGKVSIADYWLDVSVGSFAESS